MHRAAVALIVAVLWPGVCAAAEKFPSVTGKVPVEIENDTVYNSDDPAAERNDLFTTIEPEVTLTVLPGLSLFAHAVLEPVQDPAPGEDRAFADHGLYLEDLYADYAFGLYGVRIGKFTPRFGIAWDRAPGIYGTDVAEAGYEFTERVGLEGRVTLGTPESGTHTLSGSTFRRDTSPLAESTITGRGSVARADGGVSNTDGFESFAAALHGKRLMGVDGLGYHIGFISQAPGVDGSADEEGVALALFNRFEIYDGRVGFEQLVEYAIFSNADGVRDRDREFFTLTTKIDWRRWNLSLVYARSDTRLVSGANSDTVQFQASIGYAFDFGLGIDLGWRQLDEAGADSQTFGLLASYEIAF